MAKAHPTIPLTPFIPSSSAEAHPAPAPPLRNHILDPVQTAPPAPAAPELEAMVEEPVPPESPEGLSVVQHLMRVDEMEAMMLAAKQHVEVATPGAAMVSEANFPGIPNTGDPIGTVLHTDYAEEPAPAAPDGELEGPVRSDLPSSARHSGDGGQSPVAISARELAIAMVEAEPELRKVLRTEAWMIRAEGLGACARLVFGELRTHIRWTANKVAALGQLQELLPVPMDAWTIDAVQERLDRLQRAVLEHMADAQIADSDGIHSGDAPAAFAQQTMSAADLSACIAQQTSRKRNRPGTDPARCRAPCP